MEGSESLQQKFMEEFCYILKILTHFIRYSMNYDANYKARSVACRKNGENLICTDKLTK